MKTSLLNTKNFLTRQPWASPKTYMKYAWLLIFSMLPHGCLAAQNQTNSQKTKAQPASTKENNPQNPKASGKYELKIYYGWPKELDRKQREPHKKTLYFNTSTVSYKEVLKESLRLYQKDRDPKAMQKHIYTYFRATSFYFVGGQQGYGVIVLYTKNKDEKEATMLNGNNLNIEDYKNGVRVVIENHRNVVNSGTPYIIVDDFFKNTKHSSKNFDEEFNKLYKQGNESQPPSKDSVQSNKNRKNDDEMRETASLPKKCLVVLFLALAVAIVLYACHNAMIAKKKKKGRTTKVPETKR